MSKKYFYWQKKLLKALIYDYNSLKMYKKNIVFRSSCLLVKLTLVWRICWLPNIFHQEISRVNRKLNGNPALPCLLLFFQNIVIVNHNNEA